MSDKVEISGKVLNVSYHDKETNYAIFSVRQGIRSVAVKGNVDILFKGDNVVCQGYMADDKKYGPYLKMTSFESIIPTSRTDIINQLMNMGIKGLGPKNCERIADTFGEKTFSVIDNTPDKLFEVHKLPHPLAEEIIKEARTNRAALIHKNSLIKMGFTGKQASQIYDAYKKDFNLNALKSNLYILLTHPLIKIKFDDVDIIALKHGTAKNDPHRLNAGCDYIIRLYMRNSGDTLMEYKVFKNQACKILDIPQNDLISHVERISNDTFHIEEDKRDNIEYIQLYSAYYYEKRVAEKVSSILKYPSMRLNGWKNHLKESREEKGHFISGFELTDEQLNAIQVAIENNMCIINGGPGVGKTTTLDLLLDVLKRLGKSITLCAPTGKASKRMQESTKMPAKTIHRTLQYGPYGFELNDMNPIVTDVVVIDEFSMVDFSLAYHLFEAISPRTKVIVVGDINQLASIGSGAVLKNFIECNVIPVARITKIQRQAASSRIIVNAHRINKGLMPEYGNDDPDSEMKNDFFFIRTKDNEGTLKFIDQMIGDTSKEGRIYNAYRALRGEETTFNVKENCQVLTPVHATMIGTQNLNALLQHNLNPLEDGDDSIEVSDISFRKNDNVMQRVNDHEQKIYNGDAGYINFVAKGGAKNTFARVVYKDENGLEFSINYTTAKLREELMLSYAITIHKSQGSEYPAIIIPIPHGYTANLDRSLIYTAVTRGKHLVILVGSERQLIEGIKNVSSRIRKTRLLERIIQAYTQA